jgi:hypothetical protein
MVNTRAQKRCVADNSNPLLKTGILERVLGYIGPGHWYFISAVSKLWKDLYRTVDDDPTAADRYYGIGYGSSYEFTCVPQMTLYSSLWASPSRMVLAHSTGLGFLAGSSNEYSAGWHADHTTLVAAQALGLQFSPHVLAGAVRAGDVAKAKWLHTEQHCELGEHETLCCAAVKSGSIAMLDWLKQLGFAFTEETSEVAAENRQLPVLQYLHAEGCQLSPRICLAAAHNCDLEMLKWAHEHGCSLRAGACVREDMSEAAAKTGNIEIMTWLIEQPDFQLSARAMAAAAENNDRAMCEVLHAHQCPWDEESCQNAARCGISKYGNPNLDLLHWFRQHGCPWSIGDVAYLAAHSNSVALLEYMQQDGVVFTTRQLTGLLSVAGGCSSLTLAKWLRQQGAEWPAVLRVIGMYDELDQWPDIAVAWARAEGCTAPVQSDE